jgi:hypothetical protein
MRERTERHLGGLFAAPPQGQAHRMTALAAAVTPGKLDLPPEFTWRDYTIFLLTIAAQIEHSLMVQYLYAAYSLGGPQVTEQKEQEQVAVWRQLIFGIAKEEMGHLATVQNALRFLGAPLALDRQDYPWDSQIAPYPFIVERLTRASLAKYIVAESPEKWPDDVSADEQQAIAKLASGYDGTHVNQVGALYSRLIEIIADPRLLPDSVFHPESYPYQASWDEWGRGYGLGARGSSRAGTLVTPNVLVLRMASRSDALNALRQVAEQGEAPGEASAADDELSHFRRFLRVFREFPADGSWHPTRPLPTNPSAPGSTGTDQTPITDPEAGIWAHIFNIRYRMLLSYLAHTYHVYRQPDANTPESRRGVIVNRMFGEMYNLRAIAGILVHLPLGPGSAEMSGPPFQMPYTLQLPETEAAYWTLHLDLIAATADLLTKARGAGRGDHVAYAAALASLDETAAREMTLYAAADAVRTTRLHVTGAV